MSDIAIRVEGLSKQYRIGGKQEPYRTLRDAVVSATKAPFRRLSSVVRGNASAIADETIWALKDVSFAVRRGEVVGVIGRNGAGKSTLLKILSRITEPTAGYADVEGRVGSLLEVGTGFHAELSGRENILLNGAILGMKRAEIERKFDEIVNFAGVEKFIDTPVKYYSSGMYLRLAFAVAVHLEPDILIIDEVLAVGDAKFQKKCLGKLNDIATREGRTIMVVSHDMSLLETICSKAYLLDDGKLVYDGATRDVISAYCGTEFSQQVMYHVVTKDLLWLGIKNRRLLDKLAPNDDLNFVFEFETGNRDISGLHVDCAVINEKEEIAIHTMSKFVSHGFQVSKRERFTIEYNIKSPKLAPGHYYLTLYVFADDGVLFWADRIDACHIIGKSYFGHVEILAGLKSTIIPEFNLTLLSSQTTSSEKITQKTN